MGCMQNLSPRAFLLECRVCGVGWRHGDQAIMEGIAYDKGTEPIWYFISVSGWRIPDGYERGSPRVDVISGRILRDWWKVRTLAGHLVPDPLGQTQVGPSLGVPFSYFFPLSPSHPSFFLFLNKKSFSGFMKKKYLSWNLGGSQ